MARVAALAALASASACSQSVAPFEFTWVTRLAAAPRETECVTIAGDRRPCFVAAAGSEIACPLTLPSEPSWLDVAAALVPLDGEAAPPPGEAAGANVRLTVTLDVGGKSELLYDALPDRGTPPTAFGFGHVRLEVGAAEVGVATAALLRFRIAPAAEATNGPARKVALTVPRLAPRATANDRSLVQLDLYCVGTEFAEARSLVRLDGTWTDSHDAPRATGDADLLAGFEVAHSAGMRTACFGAFEPAIDRGAAAASVDRWTLIDPWGPVAPAGPTAPDADRARVLGERALFLALDEPSRVTLVAAIVTRARGEVLVGALDRLRRQIEADGRAATTTLTLHFVASDGGRETGRLRCSFAKRRNG